jgi:hypothetical protein
VSYGQSRELVSRTVLITTSEMSFPLSPVLVAVESLPAIVQPLGQNDNVLL